MSKPGRSYEIDTNRGLVGAICLTIVHSVLFVALGLMLLAVVPRYVQTFDEFGVELPKITQFVIQISSSVTAYWYLFVLLGVLGVALDFVTLLLLERNGRATQLAAGAMIAAVTLLLGGIVWLAIWIPMARLVEGLRAIG